MHLDIVRVRADPDRAPGEELLSGRISSRQNRNGRGGSELKGLSTFFPAM